MMLQRFVVGKFMSNIGISSMPKVNPVRLRGKLHIEVLLVLSSPAPNERPAAMQTGSATERRPAALVGTL